MKVHRKKKEGMDVNVDKIDQLTLEARGEGRRYEQYHARGEEEWEEGQVQRLGAFRDSGVCGEERNDLTTYIVMPILSKREEQGPGQYSKI